MQVIPYVQAEVEETDEVNEAEEIEDEQESDEEPVQEDVQIVPGDNDLVQILHEQLDAWEQTAQDEINNLFLNINNEWQAALTPRGWGATIDPISGIPSPVSMPASPLL